MWTKREQKERREAHLTKPGENNVAKWLADVNYPNAWRQGIFRPTLRAENCPLKCVLRHNLGMYVHGVQY